MNLGTYTCGNFTLTMIGKAHPKAKRISMRLCTKTYQLKLTYPSHQSLSSIQKFIHTHLDSYKVWIEKKLLSAIPCEKIFEQNTLTLYGIDYKYEYNNLYIRPFICPQHQIIFLPQRVENLHLYPALRAHADVKFRPLVDYYASQLDLTPSQFCLRDMKTRWGTCTAHGKITLNWRLILAPPQIANYVIVHEVCHMVHFNHSQNFWKLVEKVCPTYKHDRQWLRKNGSHLITF